MWIRIVIILILLSILILNYSVSSSLIDFSLRNKKSLNDLLKIYNVSYGGLNDFLQQINLNYTVLKRSYTTRGDIGRMRQLVSKLKQGLTSIERPTVTIVVFGGSTAAGAELDDMDTHFANLFGKWLEDNFHVEVILINTAVGATSSDYYAMCAGRHLHSGVDIVLGEHAVNDRGDDKYEYGPRLYKPYEASVTEALMLQVRQHAPSAIFVYVAFISLHRYCRNGEDLPQFLEVLGTYGAAAVSIRNMLLGRPSNPDNCNLDMISNALWDQLFKNRRHPTEVSHSYLAAALMNIITEEISYWLQDVEGKVMPPLIHKNSNIFDLNRAVSSMGGLVFACRTTLHPSFGSGLFPLPTGCHISWNSAEKYFFVYNC